MIIDKTVFSQMLQATATVWFEHKDALSEIDSRFGDGDHGVTIGKIAQLIRTRVEAWSTEPPKVFLEGLGEAIMAVNGGSAGPLYGTMIGGLGCGLEEEQQLDSGALKAMLAASLAEMRGISTAKVGDKTMMDALIPAVEAAQAAPDDVAAVLIAAAQAAKQGAKDSEQYVAKFGRARSYKEQTIGVQDAGAVSTALFFEGLAAPFCGALGT